MSGLNKAIIILMAAGIIMGGGTAMLIWREKQQNVLTNEKIESEKKTDTALISVRQEIRDESNLKIKWLDFYPRNGLVIEEKIIDDGEVLQISGLKNKVIEEKINSDIRLARENMEREMREKTAGRLMEGEKVECYEYEVANFSDAVSVRVYCYAGEETMSEGINYAMASGDRIHFEDLFITGANVRKIVGEAYALAMDATYANEEYVGPPFYAQQSDFDENFWAGVMKYDEMREREMQIDFTFSERIIEAEIDGESVMIFMEDVMDEVAIYKRFLSVDNLYERERGEGLAFLTGERQKEGNIYWKKPNYGEEIQKKYTDWEGEWAINKEEEYEVLSGFVARGEAGIEEARDEIKNIIAMKNETERVYFCELGQMRYMAKLFKWCGEERIAFPGSGYFMEAYCMSTKNTWAETKIKRWIGSGTVGPVGMEAGDSKEETKNIFADEYEYGYYTKEIYWDENGAEMEKPKCDVSISSGVVLEMRSVAEGFVFRTTATT